MSMVKKSGFQKLNTDTMSEQTKVEDFLKEKADQKNTLEYFKMVCKLGPYDYFVTLTFREGTVKTRIIKSTNFLIHMLNQRIYGRNYIKMKKSITGFATLEKHKSQIFDEREHIHMLLKSNKKFNLRDHKELFEKVIKKIVNSKNNRIFNLKSNDIQYYRDKGAITYAMKYVVDINVSENFKIITLEGISDYI